MPTKKATFKSAQLGISTLTNMVQTWISSLDLAKLIKKEKFKIVPNEIITLSHDFIATCIVYCISKRFSYFEQNLNSSELLFLNKKIKDYYSEISLSLNFKTDNIFQFLCIYLTRLSSKFLTQQFQDIEVDSRLQSQIYISLVFILIGITINPKCYLINRKNLTKPQHHNKSETTIKKTDSVCPDISLRSVNLSKATSIHKLNKKFKRQSQSTNRQSLQRRLIQSPRRRFSKMFNKFCSKNSSTKTMDMEETFIEELNQNLAVKPYMPPITIKKKASDLDHIAKKQKQAISKASFLNIRDSSEGKSSKKKYINSTQNSSTLSYFYRKQHISPISLHKSSKIVLRQELSIPSKDKYINSEANETLKNAYLFMMKMKSQYHKTSIEWTRVVQDLKLKKVIPSKHTLTLCENQRLSKTEQDSKISTTVKSIPQLKNISQHQVKSFYIDDSINGFVQRQKNLNYKAIEDKQNKYANVMDKKQSFLRLRHQRRIFYKQCQTRSVITNNCVFNDIQQKKPQLVLES